MQTCQPIRANSKDGKTHNIIVLAEDDNKFSVLMSDLAFPAGTLFDSAEDAIKASVRAINGFLPLDSPIIDLYSSPVEEFVKNDIMATFLV